MECKRSVLRSKRLFYFSFMFDLRSNLYFHQSIISREKERQTFYPLITRCSISNESGIIQFFIHIFIIQTHLHYFNNRHVNSRWYYKPLIAIIYIYLYMYNVYYTYITSKICIFLISHLFSRHTFMSKLR